MVGSVFGCPPTDNGGLLLLPFAYCCFEVQTAVVGAVNPCRSEGESINLPTALTAVARLRSRGVEGGLAMLCIVVLC